LFADHVTHEPHNKFDTVPARTIYASGAPLSMTENVYWQIAMKKIRPTYSLPSHYKLTNTLLDAEYDRVSLIVKDLAKKNIDYNEVVDIFKTVLKLRYAAVAGGDSTEVCARCLKF